MHRKMFRLKSVCRNPESQSWTLQWTRRLTQPTEPNIGKTEKRLHVGGFSGEKSPAALPAAQDKPISNLIQMPATSRSVNHKSQPMSKDFGGFCGQDIHICTNSVVGVPVLTFKCVCICQLEESWKQQAGTSFSLANKFCILKAETKPHKKSHMHVDCFRSTTTTTTITIRMRTTHSLVVYSPHLLIHMRVENSKVLVAFGGWQDM